MAFQAVPRAASSGIGSGPSAFFGTSPTGRNDVPGGTTASTVEPDNFVGARYETRGRSPRRVSVGRSGLTTLYNLPFDRSVAEATTAPSMHDSRASSFTRHLLRSPVGLARRPLESYDRILPKVDTGLMYEVDEASDGDVRVQRRCRSRSVGQVFDKDGLYFRTFIDYGPSSSAESALRAAPDLASDADEASAKGAAADSEDEDHGAFDELERFRNDGGFSRSMLSDPPLGSPARFRDATFTCSATFPTPSASSSSPSRFSASTAFAVTAAASSASYGSPPKAFLLAAPSGDTVALRSPSSPRVGLRAPEPAPTPSQRADARSSTLRASHSSLLADIRSHVLGTSRVSPPHKTADPSETFHSSLASTFSPSVTVPILSSPSSPLDGRADRIPPPALDRSSLRDTFVASMLARSHGRSDASALPFSSSGTPSVSSSPSSRPQITPRRSPGSMAARSPTREPGALPHTPRLEPHQPQAKPVVPKPSALPFAVSPSAR